ncbi:MAG: 3-oxoacyl-ACP synthase [Marinilabiliales bacterium]|nr:MAG: 3-oxoacyl-ACP synthase [Marinilabiliales bacterium]
MYSKIDGIGLFFPENVYTNSDLQNDFPNLKVKDLTRLTGVESRHIASKNETSVDMGIHAAENLISKINIDKNSIDYLIFCSAGGDYITPASACIVHEKLGLQSNCGSVDINQGCTGFVHGYNLANGLISSGTAKSVLLITSEAISKTVHSKDKGNKAIFGDAAAATLISSSNKKHILSNFIFGTDGSKYDQIIIKHGRERYPLDEFAEDDFIDDMGTQRNHSKIYMNGSEVFNFSINKAPELIDNMLSDAFLKIDEIDHFVFHQSNRILLETLGKKLRIPEEKIVFELHENGNTVSSSIPIALIKSVEKGKLKEGDKVLVAAFGVGFSWGGFIMEW